MDCLWIYTIDPALAPQYLLSIRKNLNLHAQHPSIFFEDVVEHKFRDIITERSLPESVKHYVQHHINTTPLSFLKYVLYHRGSLHLRGKCLRSFLKRVFTDLQTAVGLRTSDCS